MDCFQEWFNEVKFNFFMYLSALEINNHASVAFGIFFTGSFVLVGAMKCF